MIEENYFNRSIILSTAMTFTVLVSILTPLFLGMSFFLCGDAVATPHSGPTTGDETWLAVNNPHVVTADFTVGLGHNLTLEPGVRVELVENTTLRVKGRMIANGTSSSIITFTSDSGNPKPDNYWEGIIIESTSIGSIINCTEIEFANYGIYCYGSNPKITNNTISSSWFAGIYTDNANPLIYNNTITQNDGWGIKIEHNSMPMVKFNQVTSNGYDGIYVDGNSRPVITNNSVNSNFNNGIKCMDRSSPRIIDNKISSNMHDGIYIYSASPQILDNSITANNHTGIRISSYKSGPIIENNEISSNLKNGIACMYGAYPRINSNKIFNNDQDSKDLYPAIYIEASAPSVSYNNISQNNAHGIYITNGAQPVIQDNTIENNYLGIYVDNSAPKIIGDKISSNTHDGIFMELSNTSITGVKVTSNGDDGIQIISSTAIIEKSTISSNTDNGVQSSSSNFTISNSNISLSSGNDFDLRDNSHTYALNTSFDNTSITFNDAISTLEVQWYLSVIVLGSRGDRISGAQVVVNDVSGAEIYNGTSIGGGVEGIPTTEYVQDQAGKIMYTPHNVTASKEGSTAYNDSDPIMDSNKEVVVTFPIDFKISTPTGLKVFSLPGGHTLDITWDPNLEKDLIGYILYISTDNVSYGIRAELEAKYTFYIDINLIDGKSYYYKISATNGTEESPLSEQVMGIPWDIVPPIAPANLTVGQGIKGDSLFLTWDNVIDDDLMGYIIYRAQTPDGEYESIAKLGPQTQYLDTGLVQCTTYYYKITAIDEVPNESGFSNIASDTTLDTIPPNIPTGLIALLHNETALRIMWNPNKEEDLDHYILFYSTDNTTFYWLTNITSGKIIYLHDGLTTGQTYYYKVAAVDKYQNTSPNSSVVCGIPRAKWDTVPPPKVENLSVSVVPTGNTLDLSWNKILEPDLMGYFIYRSLKSGTGYIIVGYSLINSFIDTGLTDDVTYYYLVSAFDNSTNEGPMSDEKNGTPHDSTPPSPPTGLIVVRGLTPYSLVLTWDVNPEEDLAGYNIYRSTSPGGEYKKFIATIALLHKFMDSGLIMRTYYYVVTALDEVPNESDFSNEVNETAVGVVEKTWISAPKNLSVVVIETGNTLNVSWNECLEEGLHHYLLYRSTGNQPFIWLANISKGTEYFMDTNLIDGITYSYIVSAIANSMSESLPSEVVSGIPRDTVAPLKPVGLKATLFYNGTTINISWEPNNDSDLEGYIIYFCTEGINFTWLVNVSKNSNYYHHAGLSQGTYYYNISAVDEVPNESPLSKVVNCTTSDILPPATPKGLKVVPIEIELGFNISWIANTELDLHHYVLYRSEDNIFFDRLNNISAGITYNIDTNVKPDKIYYYKISAVDSSFFESELSEAVSGILSEKEDDKTGGNIWLFVLVTLFLILIMIILLAWAQIAVKKKREFELKTKAAKVKKLTRKKTQTGLKRSLKSPRKLKHLQAKKPQTLKKLPKRTMPDPKLSEKSIKKKKNKPIH